jgi:hypothetical protein
MFHEFVVPYVHEFWEGLRVPDTWEIYNTTVLFKKGGRGLTWQLELHRTIMKLVAQQKPVLNTTGDRLHRVIESLGKEHEAQNGFRRWRGCIGALFNMRLALRKRKEHGHGSWVAFLDLVKA